MKRSNARYTIDLGFLNMLTLLFVALKLTGYIAWSWWWVLAPLWVPPALFVVAGVIACVIDAVVAVRQR